MSVAAEARRPLTTRGAGWARALAAALARRRVPPNLISATSVGFAALAGGGWILSAHVASDVAHIACLVTVAIAIQLRLVANLLDGMVAVEGGLRSPTGDLWNDAPDRFADLFILVPAGYITGLAWGAELGWAAGVVAVLTAYGRWLGAGVGCGHDFRGPMAKPHRMAVMTVAAMAAAIAVPWQAQAWPIRIALALVVLGGLLTIARRMLRLAQTMRSR